MTHQPRLMEEPAEYAVERAEERAEYLERLRQKLQDPEFREIEGFPIIDEYEEVLALSVPPYYTACPNPFMAEVVEQWREERQGLHAQLGLSDDSDGNANGYKRYPFAADISEGKHNPIYRAHTYHTKVPHKAIMRYILHYTDPGDIVFDGFCGTGMTGVAAQLCADRKAVVDLGYRVSGNGVVHDGKTPVSRLGARKAILVDLSPAATFISANYNTPVDGNRFEREAKRILREVEKECGWMYETWHPNCDHPQRIKGRINYTIWSDVFLCSNCGREIVFWEVAIDEEAGKVREEFPCPHCGAEQTKRDLDRAVETAYDRATGQTARQARQQPVLINYSIDTERHDKVPDSEDLALIKGIENSDIPYWYPTDSIMFKGEEWGDTWRAGYHTGITHAHHFYTHRNLWVLAATWSRILSINDNRLRSALSFFVTAAMRYLTRMSKLGTYYYFKGGGGAINAGVLGTLYIPSFSAENNVLRTLSIRLPKLGRVFRKLPQAQASLISTQSAGRLAELGADCVDYIFTDPPFGGNLMYSELNFLWEAWLRVFTDNRPEAIVNKAQSKGLFEYQSLMEQSFREFYRLLKSGRWMTVEFHNSQNSVWNSIQEALLRAGFMVADVRTLDKKQGTFKQVTSTSAVKQDLVISVYKPARSFEQSFQPRAGTEAGAWTFLEEHLGHLPMPQLQRGQLEVLMERQPYLLYDRMVAFHIQRGLTVPLSAAEFYAGLRERYSERDGMYFLPRQAVEYDKLRLQAQEVEQLPLIVTDEKNAILWLRQELERQPQTYQQLQPKFLRELHQSRHENLPELSEILEQNFLQDDQERWYVPDPNRAQDLEKLREKALLREFREYLDGRGRLKTFRSEAIRAGFRDAWHRRDYQTIVKVAERLPDRVLQEDPDLLMYYDNARLRTED